MSITLPILGNAERVEQLNGVAADARHGAQIRASARTRAGSKVGAGDTAVYGRIVKM